MASAKRSHLKAVDSAKPAAKTKRKQAPLAGYVRVSRVGGRDRGDGFISPDVQVKAIQDWAERHRAEVIIHPHEVNVSGGTMDRPVFNEIMDAVRSGERSGIVVYRIDRFARSVVGALNTLADLGEHKAAFASCSEDLSYVKPQERAFLQMQFVFAEYVRQTIAENWSVATQSAIERGIHISAHEPFGYTRDPDSRRYIPNDNGPLVAELFRMRGDGAGWHRLTSYLDEHAPREDAARWGLSRVQRMLASRVYRGEAHYGDLVNREAHEPLITKAEFERAQKTRGVSLPRKEGKVPNLLQGTIRCASCRYTLKEGAGGRGKQQGKVRTYRCNTRSVAGKCPAPQYVVADNVEAYVVELFKEQMSAVTGSASASSDELTAAREALEEAEAELAAFTNDLDNAARLRRLGKYDEPLSLRLAAVEQAEADYQELQQANLGHELANAGSWEFDFDRWWDEASPEARKTILSASVDAIFLRGPGKGPLVERVHILWRGQGPDDLPRRGKTNGPLRGYDW